MRHLVPVFLFVLLTVGVVTGQGSSPANPHPARARSRTAKRPTSRPTARANPPMGLAIGETAEEILEVRPEVSDETLANDVEVVEASLSVIRSLFSKKTFTNNDIQEATLFGWKQLRITKLEPAAALVFQELVDYVGGLGKLVIKSTPPGALIEIDGEILKDNRGVPLTTSRTRWASSGRHRLRLILDGYETVEDNCVLPEEEEMFFDKTLKPVEKKKPQ